MTFHIACGLSIRRGYTPKPPGRSQDLGGFSCHTGNEGSLGAKQGALASACLGLNLTPTTHSHGEGMEPQFPPLETWGLERTQLVKCTFDEKALLTVALAPAELGSSSKTTHPPDTSCRIWGSPNHPQVFKICKGSLQNH